MNFEIWLSYLITVLILMSTPGPSQLLMLSNSLNNGFRRSSATAIGDLSANFLQMMVASVGLVSLIQNARNFFVFVKWAGVAYLIYLGLKTILTRSDSPLGNGKSQRSMQSLYWQGFMTSAANPKAVIFFAALFPQFISTTKSLLPQFIILSLSYLTIDGIFLTLYGKFAEVVKKKLNSSLRQYFNKLSGALLIAAAILLGMKDIEKP